MKTRTICNFLYSATQLAINHMCLNNRKSPHGTQIKGVEFCSMGVPRILFFWIQCAVACLTFCNFSPELAAQTPVYGPNGQFNSLTIYSEQPPPNGEAGTATFTINDWNGLAWDFTVSATPGWIPQVNQNGTPYLAEVPGAWDVNGYPGTGATPGTIAPFQAILFQAGLFLPSVGYGDGGTTYIIYGPAALNVPYATADQARLNYTTVGGSIQLATGSEASQRTLFSFSGARNWSFNLTYNSMLARSQMFMDPMALGWSHNFQSNIMVSGSNLIVYWDQVRYNTFSPSSGNPNLYTCNEDGAQYDTISAQTGGGWLLVHRDQSSLVFNAIGQLVEDIDPHGRILTLAYGGSNGTQLVSVTEPVSGTSVSLTYNVNGLVSGITDSAGATVQLNYQSAQNVWLLSQITNQNGYNSNFTYDANYEFLTLTDNTGAILTRNTTYPYNGNLVITEQADGRGHALGLSYSTNASGQATTTYTDKMRNTEIHTFDANFNEVSFTNGLNQTTTRTFDSANRVTSVTDPLNRTTSYTYDSEGNLLTVTDPAGNVTKYTYDVYNNLLTVTDPLGYVTTRTYDSNNNVLTLTDPQGNTTKWTYGPNSLPLTKTLPRGGVYSYAYTAGRLTQLTDPNGVTTTFGYDADGRLLYMQDALYNRTTYTYDAVGNLLTVTNPLNQTTAYACDYRNRVTSIADPTGAVTSFTYDGNSNRTAVIDPLENTTTYTYDNDDRPSTVVDALNRTTSYGYDSAGRLTDVYDPDRNDTHYEFDAAGQLTSVQDPLSNTSSMSYDASGHLTSVTDPLGRTTSYGYDADGRKTSSTDPLSRQTGFNYDPVNRLTLVSDPASLTAAQAYDDDGNKTSITNPAASATSFAYDAGGRLTTMTTAAGNATGYTYDARGLPLTVTQPSSSATTFAYDAAERLSSYTDPVSTVSFTRDNDGRVLTASEGSNVLTRVYDSAGRLTSYTDSDGNVFGYQYDSTNRLTVLTYPGGKTVSYSYDSAGRLSTVTDWANRVTTYTYDHDSRVTKIQRPDGSYLTSTFDAAGQLTQLTDLKADEETVIYSGTYGFDAAGELTGETLTPALAPVVPNVTQTFDQDNRLLTQNGSAVTFDVNGNLLSIASGVAPASYTYDARNRLISAGGVTYTYNSENRRVALTDSTGTTRYAINPNASLDQVLVKTAPNGTQTFYVYGLGLLNEETNGVPLFYHFDRLGSTVALTDSTGAVTGQVSYGSYGEILSETGSVSTAFLFNGRWGVQTDENGIYFHRARYYHPLLRRFLNQDTVLGAITTSASMNRFAYANGNPITGIDPFGLMQTDPNNGGVLQSILNWLTTPIDLGPTVNQIANLPQTVLSQVPYVINQVSQLVAAGANQIQPGWGQGVANVAIFAIALLVPESAEAELAAESGAYSAIGSTGKIGEAALQELGGESQVYFQTSQGGRYIDQLVDGIANESKVGYQSLTQSNQLQILKDAELMQSGQIQGSTWHFFQSPVTGLGGPSAPLQEFLNANGITTVIH